MATGRAVVVRQLALALVLAFLFASCGGDEASDKELLPEPNEVGSQVLDRHLTIQVTGDREATFDGSAQMLFVIRVGEGELKPFSVAHVGPVNPLAAGDGLLLNFEIGLVGTYEGAGTYELPAGVGTPPESGPTFPNSLAGTDSLNLANVSLIQPNAEAGEARFGYVLEPCSVRLVEAATEGEAKCPALVAHDGSSVSLTLRWGPA